jgi:hypothetical protein
MRYKKTKKDFKEKLVWSYLKSDKTFKKRVDSKINSLRRSKELKTT